MAEERLEVEPKFGVPLDPTSCCGQLITSPVDEHKYAIRT